MYQTRIIDVSSMVQILIRTDKKDRLIRTVFGLIRAALEEELWIRLDTTDMYHFVSQKYVSHRIILYHTRIMSKVHDTYHRCVSLRITNLYHVTKCIMTYHNDTHIAYIPHPVSYT